MAMKHCKKHKRFSGACSECTALVYPMAKKLTKATAAAVKQEAHMAVPSAPVLTETFLKALTEYYPNDRLQPGLVLAYLPQRGTYYASISRYPAGSGRVVIHKTESSASLSDAIGKLMQEWKLVLAPAQDNVQAFIKAVR